MKIQVTNEYVFNLPPEASPEDILIIGEDEHGNMIIDYDGCLYVSQFADCYDMNFITN